MKDKLYIYGCGGHARSVADVALNNNPSLEIFFVDKNAKKNEKIWGFDVITEFPEGNLKVHNAIGDNSKRKESSIDRIFSSIISEDATLTKNVSIEDGCFIAHNAYLGPETQIKKGTIINTKAVIEHEVKIGEFCHIAPNSTICGRSKIGNNVFVCAGSTIIDKINVCSDVIIGAGSVVIKDITEPGVYAGCPAKRNYK